MEALPDFEKLRDADLALLIDKLTKHETKISFQRRTLQGTIDILRAERTARRKRGSLQPVQVEQLAVILSRRTPPEDWGKKQTSLLSLSQALGLERSKRAPV
jgi:hypothetical protein